MFMSTLVQSNWFGNHGSCTVFCVFFSGMVVGENIFLVDLNNALYICSLDVYTTHAKDVSASFNNPQWQNIH